ncbi:MAG TPA: hypothetical protein VHL53_23015 [Acidimicrobiia bacterium]|nr:hypothetical protein [Acidimicrobiia bacterium]
MSYPSQKRRLRPARCVAAAVAALMAAGAGLTAMPSAQATPTPAGSAGTIQTMGGMTVNFQQGGYGPEGVPATQSQFQNPRGINFDADGNLYITDALNAVVRKIDTQGNVSLVAGTAPVNGVVQAGEDGDGGPATSAHLREPHGVAVDSHGNVYIADSRNCVIRKVDATTGMISRFAGHGDRKPSQKDPYNCGHSTVDPTTVADPTSVDLDQPKQLFMTKSGNTDQLWVTDMGNSMLRRIDIVNGTATGMTRVAGIRKGISFSDGDVALTATLRHAEGIWVANDGTVYFTDGGNNLIRKISNGQITTIAGDVATATANAGQSGDLPGDDAGDGGLAVNAHFDQPRGITGDNQGNLFIAEEDGSRIRRINLNTGIIDTIAGDGTVAEQRANGGSALIKGENGPALQTQFNHLHDIQFNPADGSLWIADSRNNRVRAMPDITDAPGANVPTGGFAPPTPTTTQPAPSGKAGYWMLGNDGKVYAFGDATQASYGDANGKMPAGAKAVHIEPTPDMKGYWINDDRGGVYAFGNANSGLGGVDASALLPGEKVSSLSSTPSGNGYWLFTNKGRVFTRGDARSFGDLANKTLNGPILGSIPTPSGNGYYMVGSDGGVFAFGDASFMGSMGGKTLNKPVMALVPTTDGSGYWLVASDGGIFAFGNAPFRGSMGDKKLNQPVVGMVRYGNGYLMVASDGGIFSFSDKGFAGSLGANPPAHPIVFAATLDH